MEYISSDTNVWIDYMTINKLELPFRLPFKYLMNRDALVDELLSPKGLREDLLSLGLQSTELTEEEFYYALGIAGRYSKLSKYDCAALAIAKYRGLVLMTGDAALRKAAQNEEVSVVGTIGILDLLYDSGNVTLEEYRECIRLLIRANGKEVRLPMSELESRLEKKGVNHLKGSEKNGMVN